MVEINFGLTNELFYGGHIPAICSGSLIFTSMLLMGVNPIFRLIAAGYLFTYATYTLNRLVDWKDDTKLNSERAAYLPKPQRFKSILIPVSYGVAFILVSSVSLLLMVTLLAPLILGYIYSVRALPFSTVRRLKEGFLLKNMTISIVWGMIPLLLAVYYGFHLLAIALALSVFLFLRAFINSVFCDIRDVKADNTAGIKTIPITLGIRNTKQILLAVNTLSGLFIFIAALSGLLPPIAHLLNVATAFGYFYLLTSRNSHANMNRLCDIVADSEDILYPPTLLLGSSIFGG